MNGNDGTRAREWAALAAVAYLGWRTLARPREADITGQTVLITGGSRGLGFLLAREFARQGCRIALCARDEAELARARQELEAGGAEVIALRCDVADREQVRRMVEQIEARLGPIDILVNNAATIQVAPFAATTLEDFEHAMAIIFWGAAHTVFAVRDRMRARRSGRIVNIVSIGGEVGLPHLMPYDCAKYALLGFSETLRAELAQDGIQVTAIVPGLVRTGSQANVLYAGDPEREFEWFSLSGATPLTSMSAERAARRIVEATRRGEAHVVLSWQAKVLRVVHDLFPGATADLMGLINRMLPDAPPEIRRARGKELATPLVPSPLTTMMNRAAKRLNQYGGASEPSPEHARKVGLPPAPLPRTP